MIYKNATIVTKDKHFNGYLEIDDKGVIQQIKEGDFLDQAIDCKNSIIMPGFIDSHTHGGYGFAFDEISDKQNIKNYKFYLESLVKEGVVAFAGTSVTQSISNLKTLCLNIKKLQKEIDGPLMAAWYFEGPFISKIKKGAHQENLIIPIDKNFLSYISKKIKIQKILTVAPEVENNQALIKEYKKDLIFALGHSNANYEEANFSLKNGIKRITHFYNAMSGFDHHDLGIVNSIFNKKYNKNLLIEIIGDSVHVDNEVLKYTYKNIPIDNICLVSDSLSPKGLKDGQYSLANLEIEKKGNWFYLKGTNILSGSACPYNFLVKNFYKATKCSLEDLVKISSYNSARNLKLDNNFGDLIIGKKANLINLDKNFNCLFSYTNGIKKSFK